MECLPYQNFVLLVLIMPCGDSFSCSWQGNNLGTQWSLGLKPRFFSSKHRPLPVSQAIPEGPPRPPPPSQRCPSCGPSSSLPNFRPWPWGSLTGRLSSLRTITLGAGNPGTGFHELPRTGWGVGREDTFLSEEGAYLEKICPEMGEAGVRNVPTSHMGTSVLKQAPQWMCGFVLTTLLRDDLACYHPNFNTRGSWGPGGFRDLFMIMQTFGGRSKSLPKSPETVWV